MLEKLKQTLKDHKEVLITETISATACAVTAVLAYNYVCNKRGFSMTKPVGNDAEFFYAVTPRGSTLRVPLTLTKTD